jgi:hypothetical protein
MNDRAQSTYVIAAWVWLRLLGIVYVIAFASLGVQIIGLVGHDGILPATDYMTRARAALSGFDRIRLLPTLAWMSTSDTFLRALCVSGAVLAVFVTAGLAPAIVLPLLWVLYLSLTVICREFLSYQWDALLLEAGLLAAFVAPWTLRHRLADGHDPPRLGRALMLWLVVRLVAGSGAVKLASGDPTWRGLTALSFHFWTQPIPTPAAWYANQLPVRMLEMATAATLAVELVAPFFVVAPRRARFVACGLLVGLQAVIALTGNYAFFNLLSVGLCIWMLDDAMLRRLLPARLRATWPSVFNPDALRRSGRARRWLLIGFAVVTVPVSFVSAAGSSGIEPSPARLLDETAALLAPLRSVNAYGLFAVMTTTRPQIVVEGSDDGSVWKAYEFAYQPSDVRDRPPWVAPHQPRLDWQLWFAALSRFENEIWLQAFLSRLLQGSPDVQALLGNDPFHGRPPKYVRALLYRYRFTDFTTRRQTGAWWTRELAGNYSPVLSLAPAASRQ